LDFGLQADVKDKRIWQFSSSGQYTAKSAYESLFIGAIQFRPLERIWKTWTPAKCGFFLWSLIIAAGQQIILRSGDYLNLRKAHYVTKKKKNINHHLTSCVFAEQFWYIFEAWWESQ
jgi:hypothetical protein